MSEYISPRKKLPDETVRQELCRRLEEYIEFAHATSRFADVGFYEKLLRYFDRHADSAIADLVRLKLTSGNSVPVDRCTVTADEIKALGLHMGGE